LRAQALELTLIMQKPLSLKTLMIMLEDFLGEPTHSLSLSQQTTLSTTESG